MTTKHPNPFRIPKLSNKYKVPGFTYRQREGSDIPTQPQIHQLGLPFESRYLHIVGLLAIIFVSIIFLKVTYLQILNKDEYFARAEGNRIKTERVIAARGIIFDRTLTPLVENHTQFGLKVIQELLPTDKNESQSLVNRLETILAADSHNTNPTKLHKLLNQVIIHKNTDEPITTIFPTLDFKTSLQFKLEDDLAGILLEQGVAREYRYPESTAHLLGYLGNIPRVQWEQLKERGYYYNDIIGITGIESVYERVLRGNDERVLIEVNSRGETQKIVSRETLETGHNLILSIDIRLQQDLNQTLSRHVALFSGSGAAVALNPNNGEIYALVSLPSYDNNFFINRDNKSINKLLSDTQKPLFNRAIQGTYPPGSTFKSIVAAAALDQQIITPEKRLLSTGGLQLNSWFFPDWKSNGHGWVNLSRAIAESVNTYFYLIGGGYEDFEGLGVDRINTYAQKFGLGNFTGIDLEGEQPGFLPTKNWKKNHKNEPWYVGDTYHLSIGQGDILVTPIQLAVMTSVFANHGTLYQPHIVKSITDQSGNSIEEIMPVIITDQVVDKKFINDVRQGLRQTVLSGSAKSFQSLPVTVAGKTGTAQVGNDKPHSWFTAFAPYENPEIVIVVLVENGGDEYNSASIVAKEVLLKYFNR